MAMVVRQPVNRPEEPRPAMARPIMNIADDCAAPHMAEPSSKTKKKARKVHWGRVRLSQASGLEGRQSTYLEGEIGVDHATQWLEGSACQLIGTRVPADVYQGVEFVVMAGVEVEMMARSRKRRKYAMVAPARIEASLRPVG